MKGSSHTHLASENCSRLSERGWSCVSGSRREKYKAIQDKMQQRTIGWRDRNWWIIVSDDTAPPDEARIASPRPLALKVEVRADLGGFTDRPGRPWGETT